MFYLEELRTQRIKYTEKISSSLVSTQKNIFLFFVFPFFFLSQDQVIHIQIILSLIHCVIIVVIIKENKWETVIRIRNDKNKNLNYNNRNTGILKRNFVMQQIFFFFYSVNFSCAGGCIGRETMGNVESAGTSSYSAGERGQENFLSVECAVQIVVHSCINIATCVDRGQSKTWYRVAGLAKRFSPLFVQVI